MPSIYHSDLLEGFDNKRCTTCLKDLSKMVHNVHLASLVIAPGSSHQAKTRC